MKRKKKHFIKAFFVSTVRYIVPHLPHRLNCYCGHIIGLLSAKSKQAKIVRQELKKLFGEEKSDRSIKRAAVKGIGNHKKDLFEIWCFPSMDRKKIKRFASLAGKEILDAALIQGRGAVIGVSHFGSWKMIIAVLGYAGYTIHQIGLDPSFFIEQDKPVHHNLIMSLEAQSDRSLPAQFIYLDREKTLKKAYNALKKNEIVLNSFDGFIGNDIVEVPFLKGKNRLATGPIRLAAATGAPLVPVFAIRQKNDKYKIVVHEPITIGSKKRSSIANAIEDYKSIFERYVAAYPDHYCRTLYDRAVDPRR